MIHTEAEAKTKWCPLSKPVFPRADDCGYQTGNREHKVDGSLIANAAVCCVTSACMLWVESPPLVEKSIIPENQMAVGDPPPGDGWLLGADNGRPAWERTVAKRGYCGLIKL